MRSTRRIILAWLLLLAPPGFAATAYLNPQAIFEGDITELVIEYDSQIPSLYALDTEALAADFDILDIKSRVFRVDPQNPGQHRMQWRLQLLPHASGRLVVPAVRFGSQSTEALPLEVKPVPDAVRSSQEVFVELESRPTSPYVGQQTQLSLRLFHNTPLRIDGLAEPRLADAASYRDSDESIYFVIRDGREFRVLERQILLFPRQSGVLELPPAVLRGQLRQPLAEGAETGLENRKISRASNPLSLQVRAPPDAFSGRYWLPARELVVTQRLQPHDGVLRIGDSIDWTLTLEATGLPAAALPENLLEQESNHFTVYADRARRSDRLENGDLVGRLEQRFAVIVTAAGEIELPAIELAWWDLALDRERRARIDANRIGIALADPRGANRQPAGADERMFFTVDGRARWIWPLSGLALIGLLWIAAGPLRRGFERAVDPRLRRWRIRRLLKQACDENQAPRARALLIEWGRARWPGQAVNGLYRIRDNSGPGALADELARLDAALFSPAARDWQGGALWAAFAAGRRTASRGRRRPGLPGLYPDY